MSDQDDTSQMPFGLILALIGVVLAGIAIYLAITQSNFGNVDKGASWLLGIIRR